MSPRIFGSGREPGNRLSKASARNVSWLRSFDGIALFVFIIVTMGLVYFGLQRPMGIILLMAFPIANVTKLGRAVKRLFPLPPEIALYTLWVIWVAVTGIVIAEDQQMFFKNLEVVILMLSLVWTVYAILINQKTTDLVYWGFIVGGLIQIGSVVTGVTNVSEIMTDRALGLTWNPNSLGFKMIWMTMGCLMLWETAKSKGRLRKLILLGLTIPAGYVLVATGSRKSALSFGFMIIFWSVFVVGKNKRLKDYVKRFVFASIVVISLILILPFIMEQTPVGLRFKDFAREGQGDIGNALEQNIRFKMYVEGLKIFMDHPIAGVGLNNFGLYFPTGQYSHSDYIEPLATTGLVGFILYQSFYAFLILRSFRLIRIVKDQITRYRLKMVILCVLTIMLIGLGTPHYRSQPPFILLTAFSAFMWDIKKRYKRKNISNTCEL